MSLVPRIAALALPLALFACATGPDIAEITGAQYQVDAIDFEGNDVVDEDDLIDHMVLGETWWVPFTPTHWFNPALLPADIQRVEDYYRSRGFYDARVLDVRRLPESAGSEIDLVFVVEEGRPMRVETLTVEWVDAEAMPARERSLIADLARPAQGERLEMKALHDAVADMRVATASRGFPEAEVVPEVSADRLTHRAQVTLRVKPGPRARIGALRFEGLKAAPRDLVLAEVDQVPGRLYSPGLLNRVEGQVYSLVVFQSVVALPAEPRGGELDVRVRVRESLPQTIRLGVGPGLEPNRWEQRATAHYTHRSLFGRLTRLDLKVGAGYAELPSVFDVQQHGPIATIEPTVTKKGLLERELRWKWAPSFELGIEDGYQFYAPENLIGVTRFFFGRLETGVSHNTRFMNFFDLQPGFRDGNTRLGLDFRDPYLLVFVRASVALHLTDRVVDPRQGVVLGVDHDVAGGALQGDFDYQKLRPEVRAYWTTPWERLQLAGRASTGWVMPYGDNPGAPIDQRFYLGGAADVRGWGLRRLSPQIRCREGQSDCDDIAVGGRTMVLGNFEARLRTVGELYVAPFLDVGDVRLGEFDYQVASWNYSSGLGLHFDTAVGLLRADFGVRLNDPARFEDEPRWAFHFALGEPF